MSSSKLFLFFFFRKTMKEVYLNSGVRLLLLELYCDLVIKHDAFFTIWAKLTVVFTCTRLHFSLYGFCFRMWLWFRIWTKIWWIDGFGEKKARIGGFAYPCSSPSFSERNVEVPPAANQSIIPLRGIKRMLLYIYLQTHTVWSRQAIHD